MRHARGTELSAPAQRHQALIHANWKPSDYVLPILALIAFFDYARPVVLPVFIACIAGIALKPGMQALVRWHLPAPVAAAFIMLVFLLLAICFFYYVAPPAVQWANRAPETTVEIRKKVENMLNISRHETPPPKAGNPDVSQPAPLQMTDATTMNTILTWTGETLTGIVETIVLLYLILISNNWFINKLAAISAPRFEQQWIIDLCNGIQHNISRYLFSITLINISFGIIIGTGLAICGLPNAIMWGGIAAILNFIPYFGPFIGMFVVGIVGVLTFDSVPRQLFPLAFYCGLHLLEADFLTPLILGHRFMIHPLVIFVSLLFWTWLWGIPGAFLAMPILVALKVTCERYAPLSSFSNLLTR